MDADIERRLDLGTELLTAYLTRESGTGLVDEPTLRAVMGENVTDDDVIHALSAMVQVSELVMYTYCRDTDRPPIEVLREVAAHRASKRGE